MNPREPSRRSFLRAGTGLFLLFGERAVWAQDHGPMPPYPSDFNAYLRIGADGRVTCFSGKVELGQGAMTSLAQCLAEELGVPFDSIDLVMGDTDLCPWDYGTVGSMCTPLFAPEVRKAGAEARAVLIQMAAEKWDVPAARLRVNQGIITDPIQEKQVSYGELVKGKRIERHIKEVATKPPSELQTIGTAPRRKDALEKITGKGKFAADIALPGMLRARILRPPAHGAVLKEVDTKSAAQAGAIVVKDGDLIAVLHEHWDVADDALQLIKAEWESPTTGPDDKTIFEHLQRHGVPPKLVGQRGSMAQGEKLAAQVVERTYLASYVAHAPMEPHVALAATSGDRITVWASTASPFKTQEQVAHGLGAATDRVHVITPYVGGAFGGKTYSRQAVEAARLARATGKPVQVLWDRAEEMFYDVFRPAAVVKVRAGLSPAGRIVMWEFNVWGAGDRDVLPFYDIPHQRASSSHTWTLNDPSGMHPFGVGPWRAPSANTNTHARESHIDILASMVGTDPVEFRMSHLSDPRMRRVLEAAARRFGWKPGKPPTGRGQGVACGIYWETRVASMAEVAVDKEKGTVRVERVVLAMDQGLTLNPEGTLQQMEGAIMMGLGYALTEEVRFRQGAIADRNFDTYEIPRFSWMPKIETVLIDNPDIPAQGSGEPVIITSGAVIANAIYDATGVRLYRLPMTPERVKEGIRNA
jgi:isoquinoline 1-oxidoreductase